MAKVDYWSKWAWPLNLARWFVVMVTYIALLVIISYWANSWQLLNKD